MSDQVSRGGTSGLVGSWWWAFHVLVVAAAGCQLWAFSVPGFSFVLAVGAAAVLAIAVVTWTTWVFMFGLHRRLWSWHEDGAFFDDAGFAYLPEGPTASLENGSFESPVFRHLGGPWYRWTASW
jgi:hypothetical protein